MELFQMYKLVYQVIYTCEQKAKNKFNRQKKLLRVI